MYNNISKCVEDVSPPDRGEMSEMEITETTVTWQTRDGAHTIEATATGYARMDVRMDGRALGNGNLITDARRIPPTLYNQGARGLIQGGGMETGVILSDEVATRCRAADEIVTAMRRAATAERDALRDLEGAVRDAEDTIRAQGYGSTRARADRLTQAEARLAAWRETHAELWATIQAEREAARARHAANIGNHVN